MGRTPAGQTRKRVFEFMRQRLLAGNPPSVREVQQAFEFRAVQSAREHLESLVADGLLAKAEGQARGYRLPPLLKRAAETCLVPLLGRVQAGGLTTALEDPEGFWGAAAEGITWHKKWDKVLDDSNKPFYRWFSGQSRFFLPYCNAMFLSFAASAMWATKRSANLSLEPSPFITV